MIVVIHSDEARRDAISACLTQAGHTALGVADARALFTLADPSRVRVIACPVECLWADLADFVRLWKVGVVAFEHDEPPEQIAQRVP